VWKTLGADKHNNVYNTQVGHNLQKKVAVLWAETNEGKRRPIEKKNKAGNMKIKCSKRSDVKGASTNWSGTVWAAAGETTAETTARKQGKHRRGWP